MRSSRPPSSTSWTARWPSGSKTGVDLQHHRLVAIHRSQNAFERIDLRKIVENDVGIVGVVDQEILMIALCRVKAVQLLYLGHDRVFERMRGRELGGTRGAGALS